MSDSAAVSSPNYSRDFNDFLGAVEKRGVGAMEVVAMDMKLRGMYIARQLSFQVHKYKYTRWTQINVMFRESPSV